MIAVSLLLWFLASDGMIGQFDGALLVVLLVAFLGATFFFENKNNPHTSVVSEKPPCSFGAIAQNGGLAILGLLLLGIGAQWLVDGAVVVARAFGVSELIIGLTVVAIGTSLPEIATSVLASIRGERDIAVGNVVGSNIINILGVLGITGLLSPTAIQVPTEAIVFDLPILIATAVACLPIFFHRQMIMRWEGFLFLGYYLAYVAYLVLAANQAPALRVFSSAMLLFVIPLTVLTISIITMQNIHRSWQGRIKPLD
jgi:cation:H+ antiporter